MVSRTVFSVVACAALIAGCGWGVEATVPSADVELTSAPVDIDTAPQVIYEGRSTYFYGDHWYYQDAGRWHTYRSEPSGLVVQRQRLNAQAPARRQAQTRHDAPAGHKESEHQERR